MSELKPCPFCGGQAYVYGVVRCLPCGYMIAFGPHDDPERASIEKWNTRAETNAELALKEAKAWMVDSDLVSCKPILARIAAIERGEA